jgi:signal transduction histidine kinase
VGDELRRTMPGTGLGLYIVRRLVELSGGTIEAESAGPGSGATVTMRWPEAAR